MALVACMAVLGVAFAEPAAPEGLENKHDYATVDISTLDGWELTYVPEARKKPIFEAILTDVDWKLRDDGQQAPFCEDVHRRLLAWDDVEIIEPAIRANRYGDPLFKPWHEQCPDMNPHESEIVWPINGIIYGSHHFKVFDLPDQAMKTNERLFYFEGAVRDKLIDHYGELRIDPPYLPSGSGVYRLFDLKKCQQIRGFRNIPAQAFSYFGTSHNNTFAESAVVRVGDEYFVIGSRISRLAEASNNLFYYRLSSLSAQGAEADCHFAPAPIESSR